MSVNILCKSALALAMTASFGYAAASAHRPLNVHLYHINDSHSHIDSEKLSFRLDGVKTYYQAGGYARIATQLKALVTQHPDALVLHAGDIYQGTLYYSIFRGDADADVVAKMGFDAYTLGNHAFDDGDKGLRHFIDRLKQKDPHIAILSANVVPDRNNTLHGAWKPYIIKEIQGEKVGIIGITVAKKTKESSSPSNEIAFLDEKETAQKYIDALEKMNVNKIILLSHFGYENDRKLAKELHGVDVIVGGDSHTYLGHFGPFASSSGPYPTVTQDSNGKKVCIVQAGQYTKILGALDVVFGADGTVTSCTGKPMMLIGDTFVQKIHGKKVDANASELKKINQIIADSDIKKATQDPEILSVIKGYKSQIDTKKNILIGHAAQTLHHVRIPLHDFQGNKGADYPLGSEIAPVVAKAFYDEYKPADACIQNAGGVRIDVPAGKISIGTAYKLLPFANTIYEIHMKGSEVKQVLEDALSNFTDNKGGSTGSFPYAYGLRYAIDMTAGKNHRIKDLEVKNRATGAWSKIQNDAFYSIVTNSYIARGKDGYTTFAKVQKVRKGLDTYLDYAMSFVDYVEKKEKAGEKITKLPPEDHCIKSYKE